MKSRFIGMMLCICMILSLMTGFVATASAADDTIDYTVENGDYLFKICRGLDIDYYQCKNAIMLLNGFSSEAQLNRISVGQKITLPSSNAVAATVKASTTTTVSTSTTVAGKTTTTTSSSTVNGVSGSGYDVLFYLVPYTVKNGDTLNGICNSLGSNYPMYGSMILAMSNIASADRILAGKPVYIPTTKLPTGSDYYIVVKHHVAGGENMTNICSKYGTNYTSNMTLINGLNNTVDLNKIKVGQDVKVPIKASAISGSSASTTVPSSIPGNSGYNITFNNSENGTPYAAISNVKITKADAGKVVYIIPNAKNGYSVKSMQVTRMDTNADVIITDNYFEMPQSDVKVTVLYSEAKKITKSVSPENTGTVDIQMNGESVSAALYGDKVTVVVTPKSGYTVKSVTFEKASDSSIGGTASKVSSDAYTFTMPNYNTKVVVVYEKAVLYTIKTGANTGNGTGRLIYCLNDIVISQAARGSKIGVTVLPDSDCALSSIIVKSDTISDIKVTKLDDIHYSFDMPASDADCAGITVTATFIKSVKYTVEKSSSVSNGSVYFTNADGKKITSALPGDTVYIVRVPNSGYKYDASDSTCYTKVTYAKGDVNIPVTSGGGTTNDYFTMPSSNVVVNVKFVKDSTAKRYNISKDCGDYGKFTVAVDESGSGIYNTISSAVAGASVRVSITPDTGYVLKRIKVTDSASNVIYDSNDSSNLTHTFPMPSKSVTVKVTFMKNETFKTLTITPMPSIGGSVKASISGKTVESGQQIRVGSAIVLKVSANNGYSIEKVECNLETEPLKATEAGVYKYTLAKEADPAFTVTFKPAEYEIQYSYPSAGDYEIYVDGTKYSATTTAHAGQTITIKTPEVPGYSVSAAAVNDNSILTYLEADGEYTFTMPPANVKTMVTYKKSVVKNTITYIGSEGGCSAPAEAAEDEVVTITLEIPSGKTDIASVTVDGKDRTIDLNGNTLKFIMPAHAVNIDASFS